MEMAINANFNALDTAAINTPELLLTYIGEDENAAFAKAEEVAPTITTAEFAEYRAARLKTYPETLSLYRVFNKASEDKVFAAKLESCDNIDSVYRFCKDIVTVSKERFAAIYETYRTLWESAHPEEKEEAFELTDEELGEVVGGAGFWKKVGNWFKKHAKTIAIVAGAVAVAAVVTAVVVASGGAAAPAVATAAASGAPSIVSCPSITSIASIASVVL